MTEIEDPRARGLAVVAALKARRQAKAELHPAGAHRLVLDLPLGWLSLDRDDVDYVARAIAAWREEVAVEDRRTSDRPRAATKVLEV